LVGQSIEALINILSKKRGNTRNFRDTSVTNLTNLTKPSPAVGLKMNIGTGQDSAIYQGDL
jgi:hypothetical protein